MSDDENVTRLPVQFKRPLQDEGTVLKVVERFLSRDECNHITRLDGTRVVSVTYLIREGETEVECGNCATRLDPMWVLAKLAREESGWNNARRMYLDEMKRLRERSRTKCDACGHMTRISRAKPKQGGA